MISNLFTIFDTKSETYQKPFHEMNTQTALRTAVNILKNPNSQISHNPEDFTLWHLGTFDDVTGKFELISPAICVTNFKDILPEQPNET